MHPDRPLRMRAVRRMNAATLEEYWQEDFDALVTTAIADAEHITRPVTAETLRSQQWHHSWHEALVFAEYELLSATERMAYSHDPRLGRTQERLRKVRTRLSEARTLARRRTKALASQDRDRTALYSAAQTAQLWLAHYHRQDYRALAEDFLAQEGLPPRPPWALASPADKVEAVEQAVQSGLLDEPVTPEVQRMLDASDKEFRDRVSDDVRSQSHRLPELRHPVMLNDWCAGLHQLMDMTVPEEEIAPDQSLRPLDIAALRAQGEKEARRVLNARRFYRGCQQRLVEWRLLTHTYAQRVDRLRIEREKPWREAAKMAARVLCTRHPEQYRALLNALRPYLKEPGGDRLDTAVLTTNRRGQLKAILMEALQDGSWRRLLDEG